MSQVFSSEGKVAPVTVLEAGPVTVVQLKDKARDGYSALQVGFGSRRESNISKSVLGHMKKLGKFAVLKEFRIKEGGTELKSGDTIDVSVFAPGDKITISSKSKGKGFQGVVKRHGFKGGPRSHGQKHSEREPGSIGGGLRNKVPKGMRMAGRMGGDRTTIKKVEVIDVDKENNLLIVKGSIPGRRGTLVEIRG